MNKGLKIALGVVISLALLSVVFLVLSKKKSATLTAATTQATVVGTGTGLPAALPVDTGVKKVPVQNPVGALPKPTATVTPNPNPALARPVATTVSAKPTTGLKQESPADAAPASAGVSPLVQWQQCKNRTKLASEVVFWGIQLTEAIPPKGTYAKGYLDGGNADWVRIIIKPGTVNAEQIKARLVVGKKVFLRGNCVGVAVDNSVVLQTF